VPDQKLKTIFERFSQVDSSDSRDKGGSGLGLAICSSIVTAHGGKIWAEANRPAGSRFQFTIPLEVTGGAGTITTPSATMARRQEHAQSVLLVEDDADLARVVITALQSHGITTTHAASGSDAIQLCRQRQPSLIVLDVVLPDMDGFSIVNSLRDSAPLRRTPLLVYSAQDVGSADQARLRLGPTEFLTKSRCSLADFEQHVLRMLDRNANRKMEVSDAA
jgi:CheY-like chemotaxis protein